MKKEKMIAVCLAALVCMNLVACAKQAYTVPTSSSSTTESSSSDALTSTVSTSSTIGAVLSSSQATSSSSSSNTITSSASGKTTTTVTTKPSTTQPNTTTNTKPNTPSTTANSTSSTTPAKPSNNNPSTTPTPTSNFKLVMPTSSQLASLSSQVLALINAERARCGVPALRAESKLTQAAQMRAAECSKNFPTYNGHMRPDGTLYATVLTDVKYGTYRESQASKDGINWYTEVNYDSGAGAENLTSAWYDNDGDNYGFHATSADISKAAQKIFNDWKSSTGHYNNMKNRVFTATGVGCAPIIKGNFMTIQCIQIFCEKQ